MRTPMRTLAGPAPLARHRLLELGQRDHLADGFLDLHRVHRGKQRAIALPPGWVSSANRELTKVTARRVACYWVLSPQRRWRGGRGPSQTDPDRAPRLLLVRAAIAPEGTTARFSAACHVRRGDRPPLGNGERCHVWLRPRSATAAAKQAPPKRSRATFPQRFWDVKD